MGELTGSRFAVNPISPEAKVDSFSKQLCGNVLPKERGASFCWGKKKLAK